MSNPDVLYEIALTKIPKVGAVTARTLIGYCGGVEAVFNTPKHKLVKIPGIGEQIAVNIKKPEVLRAAEAEMKEMEKNDIQALFFLHPEYPQKLKRYPDSPVMLFWKGKANLNHSRIVAIVGTRKPTNYGTASCEALIDGLVPYKPLVISGLAYGIDITAHRKCLATKIPTIGVLAHGLDLIYPSTHQKVAGNMLEAGGLLSEHPIGTGINREQFPMRNRIIAGLCDALIVVETAKRGGSMITAELANQYNKDVFAVPGKLWDKYSQGCNHLIKIHKAALIESAEDLAYIMRWEKESKRTGQQIRLFEDLNPEEALVIQLLNKGESKSVDEIAVQLTMDHSTLASLLLDMEFKGILKSLPGKRYFLQ